MRQNVSARFGNQKTSRKCRLYLGFWCLHLLFFVWDLKHLIIFWPKGKHVYFILKLLTIWTAYVLEKLNRHLGVFIYTDLWNNGCLPLSFFFLCDPEYMYLPWIDQMPSWAYWYVHPLPPIYCIIIFFPDSAFHWHCNHRQRFRIQNTREVEKYQ